MAQSKGYFAQFKNFKVFRSKICSQLLWNDFSGSISKGLHFCQITICCCCTIYTRNSVPLLFSHIFYLNIDRYIGHELQEQFKWDGTKLFAFPVLSFEPFLSQLSPFSQKLNIRALAIVSILLFGLITVINCSQGAFQEERMMDRLHSHNHICCHGEQKSGRREVAEDRVQWDTGAPFPEKSKMNVPIVTAPCISLVISMTGLRWMTWHGTCCEASFPSFETAPVSFQQYMVI